MRKNKTGAILIVEAVFMGLWIAALSTSLHPGTIGWNINRRALAKAESDGVCVDKASCQVWINANYKLTSEKKEYIRDKATGPTTYNFTHR